jgi:Peptidase M50B-like
MDTPKDTHARELALALLGSTALGLFFWHGIFIWPVKLLVVLMHESGHAAATLLVGGRVESIRLSPSEGGLTTSLYAQTLLRQIVVSSAGYVGSTVSGCVLLWAAARSTSGRLPLALLACWTAIVAILWVRDPFTLAFAFAATFLLGLCARLGPARLRRLVLAFLASFSVLYALFDIEDDLLHFQSRGLGQSDADALAYVTHVPALVWGLGWGALSLVLVALTLTGIFAGGAQRRGRIRSATNSASEPSRAK